METRFKSLTVFEFSKRFPDDQSCYAYLEKLKWSDGYSCKKCSNKSYCAGNKDFERQCTKCRYVESVTAKTLFHKVKFPILKAFWIVYYISTTKKGMASTELSRKLGLRQKTCWLFKQKVMRAMKSSGNQLLKGNVEVDEFVVGQQEAGSSGRKKGKKKLVVIAVERHGKKGASRLYAQKIENASSKELAPFVLKRVAREASIRTDAWSGYSCLNSEYQNFTQVLSGEKGGNFNTLHRVIMGFKAWLRGTHSQVSHLQSYLDEYSYRYNRSFMKEGIFDNLLRRMVTGNPCTYKQIIS